VVTEHLQSFHVLKLLAENHFNEDPYPITDKVYWVRGMAWEEFHIELDEEGAKVYPTDEFIELLELGDEVEDVDEDFEDFGEEFLDDDEEFDPNADDDETPDEKK
jgi:hypothetical protein